MADALLQRSFAAGEITPSLGARADLAAYGTGLRTCRNFLVRRHGGVANRPGTQFVAATKPGAPAFLFPFHFAAAHQSVVIEAGDHYFRFHKDGAPVLLAGVPLELATPYPAGVWQDPARACWSQQGFVITITHLNYPPHELVYSGPTSWVLQPIVIGPSLPPPVAGSGTTGVVGTQDFLYVVTAAKAETYEESHPSAIITVTLGAKPTPALPHQVTWSAVPGAIEYYVYGDGGFGNNTFGYLGTATDQLLFRDTGFVPDFALTPPVPRPLFGTALSYPAVNTVYQQRRLYAGTHIDRETVYSSQTGFVNNFCIRSPLQDDDAITFRIAAEEIQVVTHLINLKPLVLLTDRGAWAIEGDDSGVLRPVGINPRQHTWTGAAFVRPVVIGESILFLQARGSVLRDLRFDQEAEGFRGRDLSLRAAHLFTGHVVDRLAYAEVPDSIVWGVRSDGTLLGLTYIPEEELWGWHRHDTAAGVFEDVCVISEGTEDQVYVVVRRGVQRSVERFASRAVDPANTFTWRFLDGAVTYGGAPTDTIDGLDHLEGLEVMALADGAIVGPFTVAGGTMTLEDAAEVVHVGLAIPARLETLTLDVPSTSARDKRQLVNSIAFLLEASVRNFRVGPSVDKLYPVRPEAWDTGAVQDGRVELTITGQYMHEGRVVLEHTQPTPLTVLAALPHLTVGG